MRTEPKVLKLKPSELMYAALYGPPRIPLYTRWDWQVGENAAGKVCLRVRLAYTDYIVERHFG